MVPVDDVGKILAHYPRIYFACHARHRREPRSEAVLSEHQASIVDHLDEKEGLALKDLASHMGVTPATMSIGIDRLVVGGWVVRASDPSDGRRVALRLTRAGVRMKAARTVLDAERVGRVLGRLSLAERSVALAGLALLARASMEEMAASAAGER
jgi:DNA-binding MarR family transcriptional regulator